METSLLFVYGLLLSGEREHELLAGAELVGPRETAPRYTLVDVGVFAALLEGGADRVKGELYRVDRKTRFHVDVKKEVPILFQRIIVELADGTPAETYAMKADQVRGKRRLHHGDWRARFAPRPRSMPPSPLAEAAKRRFKPR